MMQVDVKMLFFHILHFLLYTVFSISFVIRLGWYGVVIGIRYYLEKWQQFRCTWRFVQHPSPGPKILRRPTNRSSSRKYSKYKPNNLRTLAETRVLYRDIGITIAPQATWTKRVARAQHHTHVH